MDNTSVSKGVFVNKGTYKLGLQKSKPSNPNYSHPWYNAYKEAWLVIEEAAKQINANMLKQVLTELYDFVLSAKNSSQKFNEIPTATVMTGVNLQDHDILFQDLLTNIKDVTPYVAILSSRNCNNLDKIMEITVNQFVKAMPDAEEYLKKCETIYHLDLWYQVHEEQLSDLPFVVVIPEFESMNYAVLSDFILSLSCYTKRIKFVLILGVATTVRIVHAAFTYNVISKLLIKVYRMPKQSDRLNDIIEGTMLSANTSFKLIGRVMRLLADNFSYNELSVNGYLQGYKICTINWFFNKNVRILCCKSDDFRKKIDLLSPADIALIKQYPSVVKEIEIEEVRNKQKLNDDDFKLLLEQMVKNFHNYLDSFIVMLKCLHALVRDFPKNLLGSKLREVYEKAVSYNLPETPEYKNCIQLLKNLTKEELIKKVEEMIRILDESKTFVPSVINDKLRNYINSIKSASTEIQETTETVVQSKKSRVNFLSELKEMVSNNVSEYRKLYDELLDYLDKEVFSVYLKNPNTVPAYELFYFSKIHNVKPYIVGSMKGAINKASVDPQAYLQCSCCKISNDNQILPTMLDVCIIYKLQTEHPKLINMYDWLQAFLSIINPNEDGEEQREVNPKLRARFTQAVADLEHLGFVKVSKKKVDHVKRLMLA